MQGGASAPAAGGRIASVGEIAAEPGKFGQVVEERFFVEAILDAVGFGCLQKYHPVLNSLIVTGG